MDCSTPGLFRTMKTRSPVSAFCHLAKRWHYNGVSPGANKMHKIWIYPDFRMHHYET